MAKRKKIVVGLAAIVAGGGHIALRNFLQQELENDKRFEVVPFTHSAMSIEKVNSLILPRITRIYDMLFKKTPGQIIGMSAVSLLSECEKFVKKYKPDIIVSTHVSVAVAFQIVKSSLKMNYINVNAIPDYGIPGNSILPSTRYIKPDYTFVFDELTRAYLSEKGKYDNDKVIIIGYYASRTFRQKVKEHASDSHDKLLSSLDQDLGYKISELISPHKKTVLIVGGSGGMVHKSFGLLKELAAYQKTDKYFKDNVQVMVVTGTNNKYYNKINNMGWENIIPLPWIDKNAYVKVQLLSDFPILQSVGSATINEFFATKCGPLIIQKTRRGQEKGNLDFVLKHKLGIYMPKNNNVVNKVLTGFTNLEKKEFNERVEKYQELRLSRINKLPDQIFNLVKSFNLEKSRRKRFKLTLSKKYLFPNKWLSLVIAAIPLSFLFGVVQYRRQKNKRADKKAKKML